MQSLMFVLLFSLAFCSHAQQWQLEFEQDQIRLESQDSASGIKKVRATTQINSTAHALILLLDDTSNSPQWIDNNQKVELLSRPQPDSAIVHSYFSAPWPFSDRDMVTLSKTMFDNSSGQITIDIEDIGTQYAKSKGYVRMTDVRGQWLVTPLNQQQIEIRYQGSADPAGHVPVWLANNILLQSTLKTFQQLRQILIKPKYQNEQKTPKMNHNKQDKH